MIVFPPDCRIEINNVTNNLYQFPVKDSVASVNIPVTVFFCAGDFGSFETTKYSTAFFPMCKLCIISEA